MSRGFTYQPVRMLWNYCKMLSKFISAESGAIRGSRPDFHLTALTGMRADETVTR